MTTLASDNFTRANGGLGANWTTISGFVAPQISSDVVITNAIGTDSAAFYSAITWPNDHYSEFTIVSNSTSSDATIPIVRCSPSAATFYYALIAGPLGSGITVQIKSSIAGTHAVLSTGTATINTGNIVRLDVLGDALTLSVNGNSVLTAAGGGAVSSGSPGFWIYVDSGTITDSELDSWTAGRRGGNLLLLNVG